MMWTWQNLDRPQDRPPYSSFSGLRGALITVLALGHNHKFPRVRVPVLPLGIIQSPRICATKRVNLVRDGVLDTHPFLGVSSLSPF
jgi:hypothetical protein